MEYDGIHYLVTNRHVVPKSGWNGTATALASINNLGLRPDYGRKVVLNINNMDFKYHPDPTIDIAVMDISGFLKQSSPFVYAFDKTILPDRRKLQLIRPQDSIIFVGYPRGIWDDHNILPITRSGIMATDFMHDYKGKPVFLIDASVFEGSSGSPVFVFKTPPATGRDLMPLSSEMLCLVGILAATQYEVDATVTTNNGMSMQNVTLKTYLNLGTV